MYQIPSYSREGLYLQAALIVTCLFWPVYKPIVPGVAIGFLGVVAAIMTVRAGSFTKVEMGVWVLISFALFSVEIAAVYSERDTHEAEQRKLRAEELEARQRQESSFADLINSGRNLFKATQTVSELAQKSLENLTGKDSFGYVVPQWDDIGTFVLHNGGENILSVSSVKIEYGFGTVYQSSSVGTVPPGGFVPLEHSRMPNLDFTHRAQLNVFITAQSGEFLEEVEFRRGTKGRPFEYRLQVQKYVKLCEPDKHPNGLSLVDCPGGLSYEPLVYLRNWSDEPQLSATQLKALIRKQKHFKPYH